MDPDIDFVTILGPAGTGKTLLALAAGLMQTLGNQPVRRDHHDARDHSSRGRHRFPSRAPRRKRWSPGWEPSWTTSRCSRARRKAATGAAAATNDLLRNRIKIRSLNFMRGRTFLNRYLILDEAQNLTPKQMKALITRAGPWTKLACLGNIAQIDTPYLTEMTCRPDLCRKPLSLAAGPIPGTLPWCAASAHGSWLTMRRTTFDR